MSLRIAAGNEMDGGRRGPGDMGASTDMYLDRLVKLIPAEAITAYPFLHSRALDVAQNVLDDEARTTTASALGANLNASLGSAAWLPAGVAWLLLLLVILLRWQATRGPNGTAQWGAVAISAVSFMLWVPVLDGAMAGSHIPGSFGIFHALIDDWKILNWHVDVQRFVPELLLVLWTILVPAFYRPST